MLKRLNLSGDVFNAVKGQCANFGVFKRNRVTSMEIAYIALNLSPARNSAVPRLTMGRLATNSSIRLSSSAFRPMGMHSSRMLQLEQAIFINRSFTFIPVADEVCKG